MVLFVVVFVCFLIIAAAFILDCYSAALEPQLLTLLSSPPEYRPVFTKYFPMSPMTVP